MGCLADETYQAGNSVLTVLFLGAEPPGIDDQITFLGQTLSGKTGKAFPNVIGKGSGMGYVEAELHGRGDLIDILPAGSGGADELLVDFFLIDCDRSSNPNHAFILRRVGFSRKRRFSPGKKAFQALPRKRESRIDYIKKIGFLLSP